jgi:hypothetical protein
VPQDDRALGRDEADSLIANTPQTGALVARGASLSTHGFDCGEDGEGSA